MEKNKYDLVKTKYDGKVATIIGDHPHKGAKATCLGADTTPVGAGLVFERKDTYERFFIFKPNNVAWEKF